MTTKTIASVGLALILTATAVSTAEARRSDHSFDRHALQTTGSEVHISERAQRKVRHAGFKQMRHKRELRAARKAKTARHHHRSRSTRIAAMHGIPTVIVPNPAGCPARLFCGCGASLEVFGKSIRELWLAANWFKFPKAEPAPGMVAVRKHHVFVIRQVIAPGVVLAYDANSGGRKTRVHVRKLAGFSVRNPRGSKYAAAG